jgi:hypothetical protein
MFDVNPDAAKFYLKDLERQVAASRWPRGMPHVPAGSSSQDTSSDTLVALCGRLSTRALAAARSVAAVVF